MPQALGALALTIFQAGGPLWLSNALVGVGALGGILGAVGQIALSLGISFLANAIFRPKNNTKSDDVQQSLRVAISDRVKIYGQMQATGNWIFGDSKNGNFHKVLVVCEGLLTQVLTMKIDDRFVTTDASGFVNDAPFNGKVRFQYSNGSPAGHHFSALAEVFPEWDSNHLGKGVVLIYATQYGLKADKVTDVFPSLKDTLYRIEGRFTEIYNPTNGVTAWSDNAAGIIRDFMISQDGMRFPLSIVNTPQALEVWKTSWNRSREFVPLKGGGAERRYRLWVVYKLSEAPGTVLESMLANCDARPILTRDGGIAVDITEYYEPTVLLDKSVITAVTSVVRGSDVRSAANVITAKYISEQDDYQQIDADPWIDEESVTLRGELPDDVTFGYTPSHSQCRRLMKRRAYQLNPEWQITVNCRVAASAAFQERFVALDYQLGPLHIQGAFEVLKFTWNIGDKGILQSVTIALRSIEPEAFSWDPSQEEGAAPQTQTPEVDKSIPLVAGFDATVGRRTISGSLVAYAILDFDTPPSDALVVRIEGKKVADSNWSEITVPDGALSVDGLIQDDGVQYEYRAWYQTLTGRNGAKTSPTIKLTATADNTAPGVPTAVSGTAGAGKVTIAATTPNSANFSRLYIYRNTVNNFGTATRIATVYGAPNTAYSYDNTGLTAGVTYYFWVTAANASAVESSSVATGPKVPT